MYQKMTLNIMTNQYKNQSAEHHPKLYQATKFESDLLKNTPRIKFLSSSWFGQILTLTFDPRYLMLW
jgi:hypothetical protein